MRRRTVVAAVVVAVLAEWTTYVRAQSAACTPVLLCPQPSSGTGGRGGSGGSGGAAGRAGTGGSGGRSGAGGAGGSGGATGLTVGALELDKRVIQAGATLSASVTYSNNSSSPIAVREIRIAARAPGATHEGGPYTDLAPVMSNVTLEAGGSVTLEATRAFTASDKPGEWEAYATHQDSSGVWHDAPSEYFAVVASQNPTPPSSGMTVGTQEWFIAGWAGTNIYKSGVNWSTAWANGDDIWNPTFLADLSGFSVFRHMDTNAVNWSKISSWSQRRLPTDPGNQEIYIDGGSSPNTTGMAVEWQIDLCNRASIDCWFTHPYLADDNYVSQEAQLIKAKLDPDLRAYIELSNEVWNGSFSAYGQAISAGKSLGLPGSNDYYVGIAHEMYRALQMYQIYEGVFGASAMGKRVIRVFSESGNLDLTTQALRNVYASSHWNPADQKIDMIALAPYIGNGQNGASETLSRWKSEVDSKVGGEPIQSALAAHVQPYSIPMFGCYEGGMHHLQGADAWARNPAAYDGYRYMLDRFATKMNAVCALYTLHGTWSSTGAWGLYNNVGQALSAAPKARGTKDWIASAASRRFTYERIVALVIFILAVLLLVWWLWRLVSRSTSPLEPPARTTPTPPEDDRQ